MDRKRFAALRQNKSKVVIFILVAALIAAALAVAAVANIPKEVTILDGNTSLRVLTAEKDPYAIIAQNGFLMGAGDVLDDSQMNKENAVLIIKREMTVSYREGAERERTVTLPARTVQDVLDYMGKELHSGDAVEPESFEIIRAGDTITVYKAGKATLLADGRHISVTTSNKTVADILMQEGLVLGENDMITPALKTVVKNGQTIRLTRVTFKEETLTETEKEQTVEKEDAKLAAGSTKVVQEGKAGTKEVTYKVRFEDGKEVKREVLEETVIQPAVETIVAVGTALSAPAQNGETETAEIATLTYSKAYTGIASAYYEPAGNLTASGLTVGVGRIGVNPKVIPYGTKLYVTGYGYCVAADCGWGTTGMGRIADLYMSSEAECEQWGVREVTVYVLDET